MAILGKERIRVTDKKDRDYYMEIEFTVNVNSDGYFTTTLKEDDVKTIEGYGIMLYSNGRSGSRKGFFTNKTKEGLLIEIKETLQKCISKELIEETIILRYSFCTVASFGFTMDNKIVPNMGWSLDGELNQQLYWQHGTHINHASNPQAIGVQMYIGPFFKRRFRYIDNREKTEYFHIGLYGQSVATEKQYYLRWLENIAGSCPPAHGSIKEIDYTEDRAKFFVEMYKSLCTLAHTVAKFTEPEEMIKLIETGKYLL